MTLQLRPTFSESWYRVANLKARLRAGAQISRQFYRDERWYVVRDPAGNQYHRLSDAAYRFVGLLDGTRTVEQAWESVGGTLEDDAPTQPEVIQILSHLYSANLIDADVTPDATVLLRRHKQLSKRKMQNRLMNVLFPRIPLWDPDKFLKRWMPLAKIGFSKVGALIWLAVVITAIVLLAPHWNSPDHGLVDAAKHSVDMKTNMINAAMLWAVFVFIKLIHELGHAFSCRRFGGECHELGIMFLVFVPTPYVDASSAWSFRNKWHRVFVGAAGMIVELFFASICAIIWLNVDPHTVFAQLLFNAMLVASFTTVVFNANPLLRYDGYYILSDFLEIPNLRQKSTEYAMGLLKRHIFGVKLQQPLPPIMQRFWLFMYAISSSIYRTFVGFMIILLVYYQLPEWLQWLGMLMAIGGVVTWLFVPVYKIFKYLAIDPELHRKRTRATIFTLTVTAALIVVLGFIPFPLNVDAPSLVEAHRFESLRPERGGFVRAAMIVAHDHQLLKGPRRDAKGNITQDGDVILVLEDLQLKTDIKKTRADLARYQIDLQKTMAAAQEGDVTADVKNALGEVRLYQHELDTLLDKEKDLTVRAPIDGYLIAPNIADLDGVYMKQGEEIGKIIDPSQLNMQVLVEQKEYQVIINSEPEVARTYDKAIAEIDKEEADALKNIVDETARVAIGTQAQGKREKAERQAAEAVIASSKSMTKIRLLSRVGDELNGGTPNLRWGATDEFDPVLTTAGGEEAPIDPKTKKLMTSAFRVDVPLANPNGDIVTGQKAWVRFKLRKQPLYWQGWRKLLQLIQSHEASAKPSY